MEPRTAWNGDGMGVHCDVVVSCAGAEVRSLLFLDRGVAQRLIDLGRVKAKREGTRSKERCLLYDEIGKGLGRKKHKAVKLGPHECMGD